MSNKLNKTKKKGGFLFERYSRFIAVAKHTDYSSKAGDEYMYVCSSCGQKQIIKIRDNGVVPFMVTCPNCNGDARHDDTFINDIRIGVKYRTLIRPSFKQLQKCPKQMQDYVLEGLLVFEDEVGKE